MAWGNDYIDLGHKMGGEIFDERIDTAPVVIDTRKLTKSTRGLKKIRTVDWSEYFKALEIYLGCLAEKSLHHAIPVVTQKILDDTIKWADDKQGLLGYNDYYGGLIHCYKARIIIDGKTINKTWIVSDKISPWGKPKMKNGKPIFRLMKRRHPIYKTTKNAKWRAQGIKGHHDTHYKVYDSKGRKLPRHLRTPLQNTRSQRVMLEDRPLNWRGRRLKGKKGGHFKYRVYTKSSFANQHGYKYNYYYGKSDKRPGGNMYPYYQKTLSTNPKTTEVQRGAFRYFHKIDLATPKIRNKVSLQANQFKGKIKNGIEIYNVAPYARRVARLGYNVMPTISTRQRDIWGYQIATIMKEDFKKILKDNNRL